MADQTTENAEKEGGCYCGAVRFRITSPPLVKGQCHCRACQHMAGGAPQFFLLVPPDGFAWTQGAPQTFTRPDLAEAVTRFFCPDCGTQLITKRRDNPAIVVKVGVLDDPSRFKPRVALCHAEALACHHVPEGIPVFDTLPGA
ncbi:GFA family protein [uncultured Tateyamaria sp.]|uniref:GFA family protein n=1 Tax=uncultured Tateyamaria sp. TaxID=455651 RepID=UPI002635F566|nr:GFA family protein [uncultured Tateyamaria sp.]